MDIANVISIIIILSLSGIAGFLALPVLAWTLLIGIVLLLFSIFGFLSLAPLIIFWVLYLTAASFANLHTLRRRFITSPALKHLQKQLPPISQTERTAIEAGDTWWEKELFCGHPNWEKLYRIPRPTLSKEEQDFLNHQVETVCNMLNDWHIVNKENDLPQAVWAYLKKEKFFGMVIPKAYGGLGFSALAHSTVVTKIASRSVSAAVTTMVPNSLGPAELLLHYGTDEQKNYYLPRLATGDEIPCFALTGPDAGSDGG